MYNHPTFLGMECAERRAEIAHMAASLHVGSNPRSSCRLGDIWQALLHRPQRQPRASTQPRIGGARPA